MYAGIRERTGDFKISLHGSGLCQAGLTRAFAKSEAPAVAAMGGSRHASRWQRVTHVGSRFVTPLQFTVPASELGTWKRSGAVDNQTTWIRAPHAGRSIIVTCGFSGQLLADEEWPGRQNGTQLVGSKVLPNGEKFWLLWQDCPTSPMEHSMLSEARELLARPGMILLSVASPDTAMPRILIFKDCPADRMLVVVDAAAP